MKKFLLGTLLTLGAFNAFATPTGLYKNTAETDTPMFRSIELEPAKCEKGGFIAKFYGADPFNFCTGFKNKDEFKTTRCVGKEGPYPIKVCFGIKVKQVFTTTIDVVTSGKSQSMIKKSYKDKELTHTDEYKITDLGDNKIELEYSFQNIDGRTGHEIYTYEK